MLLETAHLFINENNYYSINRTIYVIQILEIVFCDYFLDEEAEIYISCPLDDLEYEIYPVVYKTKDDLCLCKIKPAKRNKIQDFLNNKVDIYLEMLELYKTIYENILNKNNRKNDETRISLF